MTKRNEWTWTYSAEELAKAAGEKHTYHRAHADKWSQEAVRLEGEMRATGVQFREVPITGGARFDPVIDQAVMASYNEARGKRDSHQREADSYQMYQRAFERGQQNRESYALHPDDIQHFGL